MHAFAVRNLGEKNACTVAVVTSTCHSLICITGFLRASRFDVYAA
jgi:hypothetical protein